MAAPALRAGAAAVAGRDVLPRALAAIGIALLGTLLLLVAPLALLSSLGGSGPGAVPRGVPAAYVPLYRESARAFGLNWLVLASIHQQETGFSKDPTTYHGLNGYGCCAGPFQINVENGPPSTWDAVRDAYRRGHRPATYPHRDAPHPSVYDDFDAAMAAAELLRAGGADATLGQATWNAVRAYNGSGPAATAYATEVMGRARAWQEVLPVAGRRAGVPMGRLSWPVRGPVTSVFCGRRAWERCHPGVDIGVPSGTPIRAAAPGRVTLVQSGGASGGYGNFTCISHAASVSTCYAHQQRILVHPGQLVTRGQTIGVSDCTGRCFGPHLHFEVRIDGQPVCPARFLAVPARLMCAPGAPGT